MKLEDKLKNKVFKLEPLQDDKGKYYLVCELQWHRGIVKDPYLCLKRNCKYSTKYRKE